MIRRLVHFALHQPLFTAMLTMIFIAGGIVAFINLPIEAFPDVSDTQVNVIALFPGRAPEEVEKQVTIPLETVLSGVPHSVRNAAEDRQSTRLNSSHLGISYAVLCVPNKQT